MARPRTLVVTLHGSDVGLLAEPWGRADWSHGRVTCGSSPPSGRLLEEARGPLHLTRPAAGWCRCRSSCDAPAAAHPIPAGPPWRAIAIGRASPEKGFDVLLEALSRARGAGADVRLELVGSGPERRPAQSRRANGWALAMRLPSSIPSRAALRCRPACRGPRRRRSEPSGGARSRRRRGARCSAGR